MPQFLLIGVIISIAGAILANWQKVVGTVAVISIIGFIVLVFVNGMSVTGALETVWAGLVDTWDWVKQISISLFSDTQDHMAE